MTQSPRQFLQRSAAGKETMKPIKNILLCAALALAFGMPALAAGNGKPQQAAPRESKRSTPDPVAAPRADEKDYKELSGQVVYQVLLAEVALQRGRNEFASQAYADLAVRTRDPGVIERAVEVAGYARRMDVVLDMANLWVQVQPDSKRAQQVMVGVLIMSNQLDGLAPRLIRMLEADRESLPANLLGLNRMFARSPDRRAVLQLISKVCAPFFGLAEAHYAVAVAATSAAESERALAEVRQALELRPDWEAAALLQAQILAPKSSAEAIASLQRFADRNPNAREVQLHLARALVGEKRYAEARRLFEQLLLTYPNNPDVVFPVAILALQENDTVLAEAATQAPDHARHSEQECALLLSWPACGRRQAQRRGSDLLSAGRYRRALSAGTDSQRRDLLSKAGQPEAARRQLHEAAELDPKQGVQFLIAEAALLRDARQTEAALDLLERALSKQPEQPDLLYESALLAEKLGRVELLESRLRKLIELQPENAQAYNALGYSYADRNMRLPEARQLIEKALQLAPNDPFILDSMGWVLYRQGDLEGALSLPAARARHSAMMRRSPPTSARYLWTLGRKHEAQRIMLEAQKKDPVATRPSTRPIRKFSPLNTSARTYCAPGSTCSDAVARHLGPASGAQSR
jgi:tetratricopeptide (TPR) repeat protein